MEIALQGSSRGISYQGYQNSFIQCIFEEGDVVGKNERYEFRCDSDLQCCGRVCCVPEPVEIPLWLWILFILLMLIFLAAFLGLLYYFWSKREKKAKSLAHPIIRPANTNIYRSIKSIDDDDYVGPSQYDSSYVSPDFVMNGYGNRGYVAYNGNEDMNIDRHPGKAAHTSGFTRLNRGRGNEHQVQIRPASQSTVNENAYMVPPSNATTTHAIHNPQDQQHKPTKRNYEETYEVNYHEEVTMGRADSKEML
uniref:CX domain-containing protein n=1 Tax=Rhabditophanes sp. KR3021 TaxID=114890 RepID=A0AC35UHG3_9BILA